MTRIFLTLAGTSNLLLVITFALGWRIEDAAAVTDAGRSQVDLHFLTALAAAVIVMMVHAVALTYFMGTGRWIEETGEAYRLGDSARAENIRLKYRVIPGLVGCMFMVIITGAFGAIADPASAVQIPGGATIHFTLASATLAMNLFVSYYEWLQIGRNGQVVDAVIAEVRRIRKSKGLDD
ncbi:MAG: hypothetical protein KDA90_07375 [Planctomycetaceae bacterium]|nr:hypothetical protein [Planctomycetaceae bacterium]